MARILMNKEKAIDQETTTANTKSQIGLIEKEMWNNQDIRTIISKIEDLKTKTTKTRAIKSTISLIAVSQKVMAHGTKTILLINIKNTMVNQVPIKTRIDPINETFNPNHLTDTTNNSQSGIKLNSLMTEQVSLNKKPKEKMTMQKEM